MLRWLGVLSTGPVLYSKLRAAQSIITRTIPATGEQIPVIGMGSWITFDVGENPTARATRVQVLRTFFELGGVLIDSSPMYGSSEAVIGYCLSQLGLPQINNQQSLFAATKVWMYGQTPGIKQMNTSQALWDVPQFALMQIHNLLDWESHLETLQAWKSEGRIRYIGVTTSHGRRHQELENILHTQPIDFVQFTYNLRDRVAEKRLLPLATERGLAVIINRPFQRGALFSAVQGQPLPTWASEFDCANWAQFFLKFIISHPAITCAIPATSRVDHMRENMGILIGKLPDESTRQRMAAYFSSL